MKKWFGNLSKTAKIGLIEAAVLVTLLGVAGAMQPVSNKQSCTASEKFTTETSAISFDKTQASDPNTDQGKSAVTTAGVNGEKVTTYKVVSYSPKGCKPDSTTFVKDETTKQPVAEVTSVGTKTPAVATPAPAPTPAPTTTSSSCSPYYSPCVPNVSYDLDCRDIGMRVSVHGGDPYRLDADHDGIGCESY